ncbi:protein [Lentinula edodes]|uniref:Protein n=1 Tax=Lentinula edodes TaxID=5353 RepID=A0A1Q3E077_LENED|nr:protein [Lentinula edodes]
MGFQQQAVVRAKRRKTGLNSKFDQMVETMNATYRSPKKRQRTRSSSVSSYGVPQTPVDVYEGLQVGALGQDFSVIKMRNDSRMDLETEDEDASQVSQNTRCIAPLPGWLSETFTTLTKKHPLRLLLPSSMRDSNADSASQDASAPGEPDDLFAFRPPPTPAGSSTCFVYCSAQPTKLVCAICCVFARSTVQPSKDNREYVSAASNEFSMEPMNPPASSFAPASSFLVPSQQFPYSDPAVGNYVEQHFDANIPIHASTPTSMLPIINIGPCSPNDRSNYHENNLDAASDDDIDLHSELTNAFTDPGSAYISSRPLYFDAPTDDPSSDPPDPAYEIDYATLNFQWKPFDRKITGSLEYKHPIRPITHYILEQEPSVTEDLGSLPPSSDQISGDDSNFSNSVLHSGKTGSDRELPLATSSDPPMVDDHSLDTTHNATARVKERTISIESQPAADLPSPTPFRFTPPSQTPSFSQTIVPTNESSPRRLASSRITKNTLLADGRQPPAAASPVFSDPFFSPPNFGDEAKTKVEDLHVLKNNLLNTLDKIAPDPLTRNEDTRGVEAKSPTGSEDDIGSWSEEQEQELSQLGL